jgi:CBS domain-containing protein
MNRKNNKVRALPTAAVSNDRRLELDQHALNLARRSLDQGAVTPNDGPWREDIIRLLNDALATELTCVLRYKRHHYTAQGLASPKIAEEFMVHVVTDRDIAVRAVAERLSPEDGILGDVVTEDVRWCYENASVEEAIKTMNDARVRRLPVVSHQRNVVGLVSLADAVIGNTVQEP